MPNARDSQKALIVSGFVVFAQFALFLLVGLMLFTFYQFHPLPPIVTNDEIFPAFIVREPAARDFGTCDRRDLRGGDVEPERVAQLAGVDDGDRLLRAARRRRGTTARSCSRFARG